MDLRRRFSKNQKSQENNNNRNSIVNEVIDDQAHAKIQEALNNWISELKSSVYDHPSANIDFINDNYINLTSAHPTGIANFLSGKPLALSNLFREKVTYKERKQKLSSIIQRKQNLENQFLFADIYLIVGKVSWAKSPASNVGGERVVSNQTVKERSNYVPLFLQKIDIEKNRTDYFLQLNSKVEINDFLVDELIKRGAKLNRKNATDVIIGGSDNFLLQEAFDKVEAYCSHYFEDFDLNQIMIIAPVENPISAVIDDISDCKDLLFSNKFISALAGNIPDIEDIRNQELPKKTVLDEDPTKEAGVGIFDDKIKYLVDAYANGNSFFVNKSGVKAENSTDFLVSLFAKSFLNGNRTVYVTDNALNIKNITQRVHELDLDDMLIGITSPENLKKNIEQKTVNAVANAKENNGDAKLDLRTEDELMGVRKRIINNLELLHKTRSPWEMSVYDILQKLSKVFFTPSYGYSENLSVDDNFDSAGGTNKINSGSVDSGNVDSRGEKIEENSAEKQAGENAGASGAGNPNASGANANRETSESKRTNLFEKNITSAFSKIRFTKETAFAAMNDFISTKQKIMRFVELGGLNTKPEDTPWYGAEVVSDAMAEDAIQRIHRLYSQTIPMLFQQITEVVTRTNLLMPGSIAEWNDELKVLSSMRATLDVFQPQIFERSIKEMIYATASKQWRKENGIEMGYFKRRSYVKEAKSMLRPGVSLDNLHEVLQLTDMQSQAWHKYSTVGGWPVIPSGIDKLEKLYSAIRVDVNRLNTVLEGTAQGGFLEEMPFNDLVNRLQSLEEDKAQLRLLPERTVLERNIKALGLGDLLETAKDLVANNDCEITSFDIANEFEIILWTSVLEFIIADSSDLSAQGGNELSDAISRYIKLDEIHVNTLRSILRANIKMHIDRLVSSGEYIEYRNSVFGDENSDNNNAQERGENKAGSDSVKIPTNDDMPYFSQADGFLYKMFANVLVRDSVVSELFAPEPVADTLVLDISQNTSVARFLTSIVRANNVIVIADLDNSINKGIKQFASILPILNLPDTPILRDPRLDMFLARQHAKLLNDGSAAGKYEFVSNSAPTPKVENKLSYEYVEACGMPSKTTGMIETTGEEVDYIYAKITKLYRNHHDHKVQVVALNKKHADKINALLKEKAKHSKILTAALDNLDLTVVSLENAIDMPAEEKIISVGFSKTPHDRLMTNFGILDTEFGYKQLIKVLSSINNHFTLVSTIDYSLFEKTDRIKSPGALLLKDLLKFMKIASSQKIDLNAATYRSSGNIDYLMLDLAERLKNEGLLVSIDYGTSEYRRIPLAVGHKDFPDEYMLAILTDNDTYVREPSLRVKNRTIPDFYKSLGWEVVHVISVSIFLDPKSSVDAITDKINKMVEERKAAENK